MRKLKHRTMRPPCLRSQGKLYMGRVQVSTAWCLGYSHPTASVLQQGANIPKLGSRSLRKREKPHIVRVFQVQKKNMYMVSNFI